MKPWIIVIGILFYSPANFAQQADDASLIKELLVHSYVDGIYVNGLLRFVQIRKRLEDR